MKIYVAIITILLHSTWGATFRGGAVDSIVEGLSTANTDDRHLQVNTTTTAVSSTPSVVVDTTEYSGGVTNNFRKGCSDQVGGGNAIRPVFGGKPFTFEVSLRCNNPIDPNPQAYIVGTSDPNCKADRINSCRIEGKTNKVICSVTIAPLALFGKCNEIHPRATIHALCC
jgi:hypothetical protein